MFQYGESLSEKSDLEREVLAFLDNRLQDLANETLYLLDFRSHSNSTNTEALARLLIGCFQEPFEIQFRETGYADPWINYHWADLSFYNNLIGKDHFSRYCCNPFSDPRGYKIDVYEQTLACLLSAPELEFLIDEKSDTLEVTPEVISTVHSLREEYPTEIEYYLKASDAPHRLVAERICNNWRYTLNPEMPALDRLVVLMLGHRDRREALIHEPKAISRPIIQSLNLPFDIGLGLLYSYPALAVDECSTVYDTFSRQALETPPLLKAVKALPKEDIERLIRNTNSPIVADTLREKLSERTPDHSSNSLSDLAQEAKIASHALSNSERNIEVKEHEER